MLHCNFENNTPKKQKLMYWSDLTQSPCTQTGLKVVAQAPWLRRVVFQFCKNPYAVIDFKKSPRNANQLLNLMQRKNNDRTHCRLCSIEENSNQLRHILSWDSKSFLGSCVRREAQCSSLRHPWRNWAKETRQIHDFWCNPTNSSTSFKNSRLANIGVGQN